jgi:hypothetical protein
VVTLRQTREKISELLQREAADVDRVVSVLTLDEVEEGLYGDEVALQMSQLMRVYERRPRTKFELTSALFFIGQLVQQCPMAALLETRCNVFAELNAPWLFVRRLRSGLLFNRDRHLVLDAEELFFFLSYSM